MVHTSLPTLAITMGDPSGIGPEIVLKALSCASVHRTCHPLVIGDRRVLERAAGWIGAAPVRFEPVDSVLDARFAPDTLSLLDLLNADPAVCPPGEMNAASGAAAVEYVARACSLAMAGVVDAMVTAPINKEAIRLAGSPYAGHTELLAAQTGSERVGMLLTSPRLRVIHVSTHVSLEEAIGRVTRGRVLETIVFGAEACQALGISRPRVAVAGLNPHAGESGLFGHRERDEIMPAILAARELGIDASDPQPPDTVFMRAVHGEFDLVVAMYHDQGHIPMKLLAFDRGVNVTIGLPIIRTSVDHGTAFDIVGTGTASENSLLAAIDMAVMMVAARKQNSQAGTSA
jgi:4-hydroxythreonine-4-phosphate dehydrogenase